MMIPTKDTPFNLFIGSLVVDFPIDNVPVSTNEDDWKLLGNSLVQEGSFSDNGAPSPAGFKSKTEWAQAVFYAMASFS